MYFTCIRRNTSSSIEHITIMLDKCTDNVRIQFDYHMPYVVINQWKHADTYVHIIVGLPQTGNKNMQQPEHQNVHQV